MDFCDGFKVAEAAGLQPPEDGEDGCTQAPEGRHPRAARRTRMRDAQCSGKPQTAQLSPKCGELSSAPCGSYNLIFHSHR